MFFIRNDRLWWSNSDGTGEQQVEGVPEIRSDGWVPFGSGVYFVSDRDGKSTIYFLDVATRKMHEVFQMDKNPPIYMGGLSLSSDGRWLLFAQRDEISSDLMMIENWH